MEEPAMKRALERLSTAPSPSPVARVPDREQGPPCENCGKPVEVGQVVLPWDDAGEMHADCERPYSLDYQRGADEPEPVVLLGTPMRYVRLALFTASPSDRSGEG
jgi:hypothetical protein